MESSTEFEQVRPSYRTFTRDNNLGQNNNHGSAGCDVNEG